MMKKRLLIFQHLSIEHPGVFLDYFDEDGYDYQVVDFSVTDDIPELRQFDALWVMGGPMDVWQEQAYPWLIAEKQAIQQAVEVFNMPVVGICLGHQLLADALGGEVGPGEAEVGIRQIQKTKEGQKSAFLNQIEDHCDCLQWHGAEVKRAPDGFETLMSSDVCKIQAMARDNQIFSMQYHQEITATTVKDWSTIPEYKQSLEDVLGDNAVEKLHTEAASYMKSFNATARQLYQNWKATVFSD